MSSRMVSLEIRLGLKDTKGTLKDKKRAIWDGSLEVSEGRIVEIESIRNNMRNKSKDGRFKARSLLNNQNVVVRPRLHVRLDVPESATVKVATESGKFQFKLADLGVGASKLFLDGQVRVEREQGALRLDGAGDRGRLPGDGQGQGRHHLAGLRRLPAGPGDRHGARQGPTISRSWSRRATAIRSVLRRFDGKVWQPPLDVTGEGLRRLAADGGRRWQGRRLGRLEPADRRRLGDLHRRYTPAKPTASARDVVRDRPGHRDAGLRFPRRGRDRCGRRRSGSPGKAGATATTTSCLAAPAEGHPWSEPRAISASPANDWSPAIAADSKGTSTSPGTPTTRATTTCGSARRPARQAQHHAPWPTRPASRPGRTSLCDKTGSRLDRLRGGDEQWGKDYGDRQPRQNVGLRKNPAFALYVNRTVKVKCLADGKLQQPAGDLDEAARTAPLDAQQEPAAAGRGRRRAASGCCCGTIRCRAAAARSGTASPCATTAGSGHRRGAWPPRPT